MSGTPASASRSTWPSSAPNTKQLPENRELFVSKGKKWLENPLFPLFFVDKFYKYCYNGE